MYRTIDTATWDDPWFAELEPLDKLLFLYLVSNRRSTACGVFEITIRAVSFETGLTSKQVTDGLDRLHPKIVWWPGYQMLWVVNFYRHQGANGNPTTFRKSAMNKLELLPAEVAQTVAMTYPELSLEDGSASEVGKEATHTLPTPYPTDSLGSKVTVTVTEEVTVTDTEEEERARDFSSFANEIWQIYPDREGSKVGKAKLEAYLRQVPPGEWPNVRRAVLNYKASGRLPVDPFRFIKSRDYPNGMWREFVSKGAANGTNQASIGRVQIQKAKEGSGKESFVPGLADELAKLSSRAEGS